MTESEIPFVVCVLNQSVCFLFVFSICFLVSILSLFPLVNIVVSVFVFVSLENMCRYLEFLATPTLHNYIQRNTNIVITNDDVFDFKPSMSW